MSFSQETSLIVYEDHQKKIKKIKKDQYELISLTLKKISMPNQEFEKLKQFRFMNILPYEEYSEYKNIHTLIYPDYQQHIQSQASIIQI